MQDFKLSFRVLKFRVLQFQTSIFQLIGSRSENFAGFQGFIYEVSGLNIPTQTTEGKILQDFKLSFRVLVLKFQALISQLTRNRRENSAGFQGFSFEVSGLNTSTQGTGGKNFAGFQAQFQGFTLLTA